MDKEPTVRLYPESSDQWLNVWIEISVKLHLSGASAGTSTLAHLQ